MFALSVISSVIALAKDGNGRKPPKADEKAPPSQPQETEGVRHERPYLENRRKNDFKDSLPPSQVRNPGRHVTQRQDLQAVRRNEQGSDRRTAFLSARSRLSALFAEQIQTGMDGTACRATFRPGTYSETAPPTSRARPSPLPHHRVLRGPERGRGTRRDADLVVDVLNVMVGRLR